jgi:DNA modification methylase
MIINASAFHIPLAAESVQCVVTSPPYFGLRRYAGSKEGDFVLDPFGGSGTTGIVANRMGRIPIMLDTSYEYCELMTERLQGTPTNAE